MNSVALECIIISSTAVVEQLDRLAVNSEDEIARKIRLIRKQFLAARSELYAVQDARLECTTP